MRRLPCGDASLSLPLSVARRPQLGLSPRTRSTRWQSSDFSTANRPDHSHLIFRHILPMEALMNRGSYPYKLTAEDHLLIKEWKWGVGAVYAAVLLVLVLIVAAAP